MVVLVPRQAGKTLLVSVVAEHRCLTRPGARCWYTNQTGAAAGAWMRDEHVPLLRAVPALAGGVPHAHEPPGPSRCAGPASGSSFTVHAPTRDAMHGKQSDLSVVDEAWAFDALRGDELLQGIGPTQATRRGAQLWIVSAAGDAASAFLADQVTAARAAGPSERVCLIEYGVPDDLDATDPDVVAGYHPGRRRRA